MMLSNLSLTTQISLFLFCAGICLALASLLLMFFIKNKWLSMVEDVVDNNYYSFSLNIFSASLGISRYGLIFQFHWQAKRCDRLKQRDKVPKEVQKLFITNNIIQLIGFTAFFSGIAIIHI
ncbi:hypothetical protein PBPRA3333 [Photobacterium profundum SS9]|uniref:Uncharacterized protein n=1 Tax=Photobacterium profundum (strain SS9) TaxID=298386 RepID=Q6LM47_PHOPR|nr:hypothetical protein PBPRA3333 [Photobacterium profundum SS9]